VRVIWSTAALDDVGEIRLYIGRDNPATARRVAARLVAKASSLELFPERGRAGVQPGTRELVVSAHIIVYRIDGDLVRILRVLHHARDRRSL
jgi:addiction module RelE/StbE family toxin